MINYLQLLFGWYRYYWEIIYRQYKRMNFEAPKKDNVIGSYRLLPEDTTNALLEQNFISDMNYK